MSEQFHVGDKVICVDGPDIGTTGEVVRIVEGREGRKTLVTIRPSDRLDQLLPERPEHLRHIWPKALKGGEPSPPARPTGD